MTNWKPLLTEIEKEFVKREATKPAPFRTTYTSLQLTIDDTYIPTIRLGEDDMEDTLPGIGFGQDVWEAMSAGLELGEEVPFDLDLCRATRGQFYNE